MQIEIISNINMDSLKFYLKDFNVNNSCSYGNYLIDLLDNTSSLYSSNTNCVVCFLDIDTLNDSIDDILGALLNLKNSGKIVILNNLSSYPYYIDTFINNTIQNEYELNQKILDFCRTHNFLMIDFSTILKRLGYENVYNEKFWYLAKIKFSSKVFELLANEIKNLLNANQNSCKKCLVLDLDNTLWKGVIGEGLGEIELSNESEGSIFQQFQKSIKKLKDFGILLAINSKNNYEDAIKGLEHPSSILCKDDFISIKANWQNKDENLRQIAKELNISEDSLVFIDDNKVERELAKTNTKVCVPDFPEDIYSLNSWFRKEVVYKYFFKLKINDEDLEKQNQYKAKLQRDEISKTMSYEDFLKSLRIKLDFYIDDKRYSQRYAQLTQKTNQFNLTTKRYSEQEIQDFIESSNHKVIAVEYQDKFAKEGIIGLCILEIKDDVYIDTFLLSCRVLKRDVEKALIQKVISLFPNKNIKAKYIKSEKNEMVKDLYENLGFKKLDDTNYEREKTDGK